MASSEKPTKSKGNLVCSFCGKPEKQVKKMIRVGTNNKPICNECISICTQIMDDVKNEG